MCSIKTLDSINRAVVDGAIKYGSNALYKVFLYGSYARQDYDSESDIDYMIVMDGNPADMKKLRREMLNVSEQISYDNDVVVSVFLFSNYRKVAYDSNHTRKKKYIPPVPCALCVGIGHS